MRKNSYFCSLKKMINMKKTLIYKGIAVIMMAVPFLFGDVVAQETFNPCPDVVFNERVDHVPLARYRQLGWDTVVNCENPTIEISAEPYIPVQYFNGTYKVESVPYNPPDPTFHAGTRMPVNTDDNFSNYSTNIPYPFFFFGIRKTSFVIGANGLVAFGPVPVTNTTSTGPSCPWSYSAGLPWTDNTSGTPGSLTYMRDAIYGVYEDTYPSPSVHGSNGDPNWGIYYGVQDEYPCRKIICSWNDVPQYSCTSMRCTYQIVCYEGSNIIEVHVKQRQVCMNWNGGHGLIGIQNATGQPQVKGPRGSSNMYVDAGSPAAFWPAGYNVFTSDLDSVAFRFTPQGRTSKTVEWYRIFDDGRDSVMLTQNVNDTNGYVIPMNDDDSVHPTLTKAVVHPTVPSRYVISLRFLDARDAEDSAYVLNDTIFIGVDFGNDLALKSITPQHDTVRKIDICNGQTTAMQLTWPSTQEAESVRWYVERILNGRRITLPASMYTVDEANATIAIHPDPQFDTLPVNHIDSIRVMASVNFVSHCSNYDTFLVRVYPNFDTVNEAGICNGETYVWPANGMSYTENTTYPVATLHSQPGCDSVVHLHLTVYDVSLTIDPVVVCSEFTWRNGRTYTENNNTDTVVLKNRYNCDSIVQLDLTVYPTTARMETSLDMFTYDKTEVLLTDVSTGSDGRLWLLPTIDAFGDSTTVEAQDAAVYYTIPDTMNGATIYLIAHSPHGCLDTTSRYLPFYKETMWMPTIFMPDDPGNNNIFRSYSVNTISQEMWIYDRAGRIVAHCQGVGCGWDGRDVNGNPCPQGGYVYVVKYSTKDEPHKTMSKHGSVTLIR